MHKVDLRYISKAVRTLREQGAELADSGFDEIENFGCGLFEACFDFENPKNRTVSI